MAKNNVKGLENSKVAHDGLVGLGGMMELAGPFDEHIGGGWEGVEKPQGVGGEAVKVIAGGVGTRLGAGRQTIP